MFAFSDMSPFILHILSRIKAYTLILPKNNQKLHVLTFIHH